MPVPDARTSNVHRATSNEQRPADPTLAPTAPDAEVERTFAALEADFRPADEVGRLLIRRAAVCSVRMERGVVQEAAALTRRVLEAQAEARARGEDPAEAGHIALFDPSREASLARKYEAAAERGFFRALKEFRQHQRSADVPSAARAEAASTRKQIAQLASFFPVVEATPAPARSAAAMPAAAVKPPSKPDRKPVRTVFPAWNPVFQGSVDVPITIGKAR